MAVAEVSLERSTSPTTRCTAAGSRTRCSRSAARVAGVEAPRHGRVARRGAGRFWVLSRHDDLRAVNRGTETFVASTARRSVTPRRVARARCSSRWTGRLTRDCVGSVSRLHAKMMATLDEELRWRTDRILDAVVATGGEVDFVPDVAETSPPIADIIGIPEDDERRCSKEQHDPPGVRSRGRRRPRGTPRDRTAVVRLRRRLQRWKRAIHSTTSGRSLVQAEVVDDDGTRRG